MKTQNAEPVTHTREEWNVTEYPNNYKVGVFSEKRLICTVEGNTAHGTVEQIRATAKLIAGAPALLTSVRELLEMVTDNRTHGPEIDRACAAIAKATS